MRTSRRYFLKAASAAPALGLRQPGSRTRVAAIRDSSFDPWVEIDATRLRHNVAEIARRSGRPILAVIKNNGYGSGVANVARVLDPLPSIAGFAVVKLHEAMTLRDAGVAKPLPRRRDVRVYRRPSLPVQETAVASFSFSDWK